MDCGNIGFNNLQISFDPSLFFLVVVLDQQIFFTGKKNDLDRTPKHS